MTDVVSLASRARGAVVGGLVADAAAVPCHWCYDPTKLAEHIKAARRGPAFCDPPGNVFYTPSPGGFSCYGEQTMALLESLVACEGKLNVEDYASRLEEKFGKASSYEVEAVDPENWPELKVNPTDADGKVIEAERKWSMPLPGPWRHGSVKGFLKHYVNEKQKFPKCGSSDEQVPCQHVQSRAHAAAVLQSYEEASSSNYHGVMCSCNGGGGGGGGGVGGGA